MYNSPDNCTVGKKYSQGELEELSPSLEKEKIVVSMRVFFLFERRLNR